MPRQKSIVTIIRDLVRDEIQKALDRLFQGLGSVGVGPRAAVARTKPAPKNGRRRRRKTTGRTAAAPAGKRRRGAVRKRRKPASPEG